MNSIIFQSTCWNEYDSIIDEEDNILDKFNYNKLSYIIYIYGRTLDSKSVCLEVHGMYPEFYISIPSNKLKKTKLINEIKTRCDYNKQLTKFSTYKKEFYGFTNNREQEFIKLVCNNLNSYYASQKILKKSGYSLYESNFDTFLKFLHIKNLNPSSWLIINNYTKNEIVSSSCNINIVCHMNDIYNYCSINPEFENKIAPFVQASFDIETFSSTGAFPSPDIEGDCIIQIATTFKKMGSDDFYTKSLITLKECNTSGFDKNVSILSAKNEKDLIFLWAKLINQEDPDVIYHYNGDWFDWWYIYERAKRYGDKFVKNILLLLNRITPHTMSFECFRCCKKNIKSNTNNSNSEKYSGCSLLGYYNLSSFSSGAYGTSKYRRVVIPGRINFDILIYIQREYKEKKYTLDYISKQYLNESKVDLPYNKMFDMFTNGTSDDIKEIAKYCIKDSELPQRLVDKLDIFQTMLTMSNVTYVPVTYLIEKGQQIKVFSQIMKLAKKKNYVIPVLESKKTDEKYEGAVVWDPVPGAYMQPVTVCDFASLYPSIIRRHNLCYSTYITDPEYLKMKGIEYIEVKCGDRVHYFVQNSESVLPELLAELAKSRKLYKKKMAEATDKFTKELYNTTQKAYKVSMNSVYGFLAAQKLTCKPIAESVTSIGRTMFKQTKEYMEKNYEGSKIIYGDTDSVFVLFKTKSLELFLNVKKYISENPEIRNDKVKMKNYRDLEIKCIEEAMEMGKNATTNITKDIFRSPISLEFEKVYYPFIIPTKKRYFGGYYSSNAEKYDYKECKGLLPNRRDNCILATDAFNMGINLIVDNGVYGLEDYCNYLKKLVQDLKNNKIDDIDKFIIIKKLNDTYKTTLLDDKNEKHNFKIININNKKDRITIGIPKSIKIDEISQDFSIILSETNEEYNCTNAVVTEESNLFIQLDRPIVQDIIIPKTTRSKGHTIVKFKNAVLSANLPHVVLARKLKKRNPENPPKTNDRIPYIFVHSNNKKSELFKKVEDPEYAKRNELKIDTEYYIGCVKTPISQILELFDKELPNKIFL